MAPIAIYEQQIEHYNAELAKCRRQLSLLGYLRLFSFVIMVLFGYWYIRDGFDPKWLLPIVGMLCVFVTGLVYYTRTQYQQAQAKLLLKVNEQEVELATTGHSSFANGGVYGDETHPYAGDLDVFGHASLYSHMNRAGTISGGDMLGAYLSDPGRDPELIRKRQDVSKVLASKLVFRQLFLVNGIQAGEKPDDLKQLQLWLDMPFRFINNRLVQVMRWVSPVLSVIALGYLVATHNHYPLLGVLALNGLILRQYLVEVNRQHILISSKEGVFRKFALLLQMINKEDFEDVVLLKHLQAQTTEAAVALKQLARICNAWDQRLNMLVGVILNVLGLYDLHCGVALEKWKERYKDKVDGWFNVLFEMEVYNSMATFAYNHPGYIYPEVDGAQLLLVGKGIGHPLIPEADCVKNDIGIGVPEQFLIITGSNMSGKSTFLRSVGTNLLMAMCGMPVCAEEFRCSPMKIMTSMRIKDSIAKHTSYFQAELLRLQEIVRVLKSGEKVFILLDEILKGTNSEDKLSGSRSLIAHFLQYNCLGMIATHDLELGHMEEEYAVRIRNYCFESTIKAEQLYFDYRIREGVARNKNATFLMKKMEII